MLSIDNIVEAIRPADQKQIETARAHTAQLAIPPRALGRLHDIAERLCGIGQTQKPSIANKSILIMAGDHGVASEGVSAFPQDVTGAMVKTFLVGGGAINAIARHVNAQVWVVDMGILSDVDPGSIAGGERLIVSKVGCGTASFVSGPAMTREQAQEAILKGFRHAVRLFDDGVQIIGAGDMGIANTTPSAAIGAVITGAGLDEMVGRGTGISDQALTRKKAAIARGIAINQPDPFDGIDVLAKVGGFEIGGIAGIVLAGAYCRKPVVVDGFISTAGALIAATLCPFVTDYLFAGHQSEEPGHKLMLAHLGLEPILTLGMRLGEGTGGAMAMSVMDGAVRVFKDVLTFEQAGVACKEA